MSKLLNDLKGILRQILDSIEFPDEQKDATIVSIISLVNEYSLIRLLIRLDEDSQVEFKSLVKDQSDQTKFILDFLKKHYKKTEVDKILSEEARKLVYEYMQEIAPLMSDEEKDKVRELLEKYFQ